MKNNINKQSHNEVKELLNDYVVSPLNDDISKTLYKIVESIEDLKDTINNDINQSSSKVTNRINDLKRKLDTSYHFDNDEDVFEILNNSICDNVENTSKKRLKQINDTISSSYDEVKNEFDGISSELSSIISQINKLSLEHKTDNENLSNLITSKYDTLSELMRQVLKLLNINNDTLKNSINELNTLVSEEIKNTNEIQKQQNDNINNKLEATQSQLIEIYIKHSKKQFITSLALGISNLIGIIAIILIFLL